MLATIKDGIESNSSKKIMLKVQCVERVKDDVILIADKSGVGILLGSGEEIGKMQVERSYLLMLPVVVDIDGIKCFKAVQVARPMKEDVEVDVSKMEEVKVLAELIPEDYTKEKKEADEADEADDVPKKEEEPSKMSVEEMDKLKVDVKVDSITLKAVLVSPEKGSGSKFRTVKFRDLSGSPVHANLFGDLKDEVKIDKVYHVKNITKSDFKAPSEEFNRFNARSGETRLIEYSDPEKQYEKLSCGDGIVKGTIVGFNSQNFYRCCPFCRSKVLGDKCGKDRCGKKFYSSKHDFNFKVLVVDEEGEDAEFFGFKRDVGAEEIETEEKMNDFLDEFVGKTVKIDYTVSQYQKNIDILTIL